ncbi:Putative ATP-dependent RNA helicase A [Durusdinium trenchii]|uniref:ATP-dependent RNA helicase A n=1 Tax=Durusdinium trenchii TaxID=1381693 RepID=A0ABP0NHY8_9DINO
MWVMGPIGDVLLKKLKEKNQQGWMPSSPLSPMSPTRLFSGFSTPSSPSSVAHRQGKCTIEGSRCRQYDPILFVPQSLMDSLEVSTDLKRAVKQLMEEATSLTADQRLELLPGLPPHDVYFDLYEPIPNGAPSFAAERGGICGRFRIREERWQREMAASSSKLAIKRLSDMQFVCNEMLLPELVSWCDQYKAIKAKRLGEKAFHLAEERELAKIRRERSQRRYKNPEIQDSELFERGQLRAKKVAELEAKAATEGLDNAVEVCKCGYHQIWHQGRATLDSLDLEMTSRSDLSSLTAPRPRSSPSESLPARALISQSRWPQKEEGEAVVSAGRLSLKKVGSAVLAATFS